MVAVICVKILVPLVDAKSLAAAETFGHESWKCQVAWPSMGVHETGQIESLVLVEQHQRF